QNCTRGVANCARPGQKTPRPGEGRPLPPGRAQRRTICTVGRKRQLPVRPVQMERSRGMSDQHLATYLNDHLAGSVVALELLEHLEKAHAGTDVARFVAALRADIEADRGELEALMQRLHVSASL